MKALNFTKTQNSIQDYLLIQKSLLKLNIYYDSIEYDFFTESPQIILTNFILNIIYSFCFLFGNFKYLLNIKFFFVIWYFF